MGIIGAAGSVVSSAKDMARWLLFHLAKGRNQDGDEVVKWETLRAVYEALVVDQRSRTFNEYNIRPTMPITGTRDMAGMGWIVGYYRGK